MGGKSNSHPKVLAATNFWFIYNRAQLSCSDATEEASSNLQLLRLHILLLPIHMLDHRMI